MRTRIIDGLKVISQGDGRWLTEDGRYEIRLGYGGLTTCDEAGHPVRITRDLAADIRDNPHAYPAEASWAVRTNQRGYFCPGSETHQAPDDWQVWDNQKGDYVDEPRYESFQDAVGSLARILAKRRQVGQCSPC